MFAAVLACADPTTTGGADPTSPGPTPDPDVHSYWPDAFPPDDPVNVVFFGDSITRGYGITSEDSEYTGLLLENNDRKWPDWSGDDLRTRWPGLTNVLDVSADGATTDSVLAEQIPEVEAEWGPVVEGQTIVVGTIGGNDVSGIVFGGGSLPEEYPTILANLEEITDFFLDPARFPDGAFVAITNVYEPSDGAGQVDECFFGLDLSVLIPSFDGLAADSRAQAERDGWAWVDLRGHFVGHGFHFDDEGPWYDEADPTLWLQDDCIHPNVRGHHELRRLFLAALDGQPLMLE